MSSYKLIAANTGSIVDAVLGDPCWVKYDPRLRLFMACKESQAQGIASHDGMTYWHLKDRPDFGVDGYETVSVVSISEDEADEIIAALDANQPIPEPEPEVPDDGSVEIVRENIINQMSAACNAAIVGGVDVMLSDGKTYHFSLQLEDQLNMLSLQGMIANGTEAVPYHADGEECRYYSADDFTAITAAATNWKLYNESYFNSLRAYIQSMDIMAELLAVEYGIEVPLEYQTYVLRQIMSQMGGS